MSWKRQEHCTYCQEAWSPEHLVKFFSGDSVCPICLKGYLQEHAYKYVDDYIENAPQEYYQIWWFDSLSSTEQLEVIRMGYQGHLSAERQLYQLDRQDFCHEQPDFLSYVQDCLR